MSSSTPTALALARSRMAWRRRQRFRTCNALPNTKFTITFSGCVSKFVGRSLISALTSCTTPTVARTRSPATASGRSMRLTRPGCRERCLHPAAGHQAQPVQGIKLINIEEKGGKNIVFYIHGDQQQLGDGDCDRGRATRSPRPHSLPRSLLPKLRVRRLRMRFKPAVAATNGEIVIGAYAASIATCAFIVRLTAEGSASGIRVETAATSLRASTDARAPA